MIVQGIESEKPVVTTDDPSAVLATYTILGDWVVRLMQHQEA